MAEFGATRCTFEGCSTHDFLPFTCQACGGIFCLKHRGFNDHTCPQADDFLVTHEVDPEPASAPVSLTRSAAAREPPPSSSSSSIPSSSLAARNERLAAMKPSEVFASAVGRFDGKEAELNGFMQHFNNIRRSDDDGGVDGSIRQGAPDRRLLTAQAAMAKASTTKGKKVAQQVQKMLIKSKAAGDKKVRMEDRYFLEVRYCGNEEDVHFKFFSRTWTVGRVLDTIASLHRSCIKVPQDNGSDYGRGGGGYVTAGQVRDNESLSLVVQRTNRQLPLSATLCSLSADVLEEFDVIILAPRSLAELLISTEESMTSSSVSSSSSAAATTTTTMVEIDRNQEKSDTLQQTGELDDDGGDETFSVKHSASAVADSGVVEARSSAREGCGGGGGGDDQEYLELHISHGKTKYSVKLVTDATVLDLKRELEAMIQVPFTKQKLLFKGKVIKEDTTLLTDVQLLNGSKVVVMGTAG